MFSHALISNGSAGRLPSQGLCKNRTVFRPFATQHKGHRPRNAVCKVSQQCTEHQGEVFEGFVHYIHDLQRSILSQAEKLEEGTGKHFMQDTWQRDSQDLNAGYGVTAVLEGGYILEKAAANISVLKGTLTAARASAMSSRGRARINPKGGQPYSAAALSLVFHSANPYVPTLRADVRLFQVGGETWYGGGCDLTPFYVDEVSFTKFHSFWKGVCDEYHAQLYPDLKAHCDRYFYIPARKEHRGVGGIFFDDMAATEQAFDVGGFVRTVGNGFLPSWLPIAQKHMHTTFSEDQRNWQLLRRGRYLEFNLLYDRGVKFGLDGGRVESIMVSAPPLIAWKYNAVPETGTPEAQLLQVLSTPREWV